MSVLKESNQRDDYKLVGASLPLQVHSYLTLYCLAKGVSKTKIIKGLLENWIACQVTTHGTSPAELVLCIIKRAGVQWKARKASGKMSFKEFKESLQAELTEKGVSEDVIASILNGIKQ